MQVGHDDTPAATKEWHRMLDALKKRFNITDMGDSKYMLGMRITRDEKAGTITLDQELYVTKALEKYGYDGCRVTCTPTDVNDVCKADDDVPLLDVKHHQEKVGTLMYAAISTRIDIAYAVNVLARHLQAPTRKHERACDRVFRYLAGTKGKGLLFGRTRARQGGHHSVSGFSDADWGSDVADRKSVTGWIAMIDGDPVSWCSKKQRVVAQSSCESELYAEAAAINELKWLHGLLKELKLSSNATPVLYMDNTSAVSLSENGVKSERTKHIDLKYHFVHDEVSKGRIAVKWVPTRQQLADVLTKGLGRVLHEDLCRQLLVNA
jgi:hypothetical protein